MSVQQEGINKPVTAPGLDDILDVNNVPASFAPAPTEPVTPVNPITPPVNTPPTTLQNNSVPDPFELVVNEPFTNTIKLFATDETTLTPEDKQLRTEILSKFKADKLDENSNLVDKDGKIVLSKDNFKSYVVDGKMLTDAEGNEVNEAGEILRTNEDILQDETVIFPLRKSIELELGFNLGNKVYEDTIDGIKEMTLDAIKLGNTDIVKSWLAKNPEVFDFYKHKASGGTIENFTNKQVDYTAINLKTLDADSKLSYIKEMFTKQSMPNAQNMLELIKAAGEDSINTTASQAILFLDAKQKEERSQLDLKFQQEQDRNKQEAENYWNTVTDTIKKGTLGNIKLPETEKQLFLDYLSKPIDKDGNSADMLAADKDSVEFQLMVSYLRMNKFDISKVATLIAREESAKKLRDRLSEQGNKNVISATGAQNTPSTRQAMTHPTLDTLLP